MGIDAPRALKQLKAEDVEMAQEYKERINKTVITQSHVQHVSKLGASGRHWSFKSKLEGHDCLREYNPWEYGIPVAAALARKSKLPPVQKDSRGWYKINYKIID